MSKSIKNSNLFTVTTPYLIDLFNLEYCYEVVKNIGDYILKVIPTLQNFTKIADGVYVGKNVKIHGSAVIEPPVILGNNTVLRPSAYLRGNVITGENCVIGNSTEVKNSVLLNGVQLPHYNYVGDSVLGNFTHLGAGAICSNLKLDGTNICLKTGIEYDTKMRKLGAILGDGVNVGAGTILNPGTVLGKNTILYPNLCIRGVYDSNLIIKARDNITKKEW